MVSCDAILVTSSTTQLFSQISTGVLCCRAEPVTWWAILSNDVKFLENSSLPGLSQISNAGRLVKFQPAWTPLDMSRWNFFTIISRKILTAFFQKYMEHFIFTANYISHYVRLHKFFDYLVNSTHSLYQYSVTYVNITLRDLTYSNSILTQKSM